VCPTQQCLELVGSSLVHVMVCQIWRYTTVGHIMWVTLCHDLWLYCPLTWIMKMVHRKLLKRYIFLIELLCLLQAIWFVEKAIIIIYHIKYSWHGQGHLTCVLQIFHDATYQIGCCWHGFYTAAPRRGRGVYCFTSVRPSVRPRYFLSHFSQ
jgi:hypothetical protein